MTSGPQTNFPNPHPNEEILSYLINMLNLDINITPSNDIKTTLEIKIQAIYDNFPPYTQNIIQLTYTTSNGDLMGVTVDGFAIGLFEIPPPNSAILPQDGSEIAEPSLLSIITYIITNYELAKPASYMLTSIVPTSNICFPKGTLISCNQGEIPIEQINPKVHTIRGKQIVAITKTSSTSKYLICFEKGSLGHNIPSRQTIMSENHQLIYNGNIKKALHFVDNYKNVNRINYYGETLYNILMKQHDTVMINNLICETLHPENVIAKIHFILKNLNPTEQSKFIQEYNRKYAEKNVSKSNRKMLIY